MHPGGVSAVLQQAKHPVGGEVQDDWLMALPFPFSFPEDQSEH